MKALAFLAIAAVVALLIAGIAQPRATPVVPKPVAADPCSIPRFGDVNLLQLQECQPRLDALIRAQVNEEEARKAKVRAASGYRDPPGTKELR